MIARIVLAAVSLVVPMTVAHAADQGQSAGTLGNHPAVTAHLLAMPAGVVADRAQHPAVTLHSWALGGVVDQAAAPKVQTAFHHGDFGSSVLVR